MHCLIGISFWVRLFCVARCFALPDRFKSLRSLAGRGVRGNRGVYNDYAGRKDGKPQLNTVELDKHLGRLLAFCSAPRLQSPHFRFVLEDLVMLNDALSSYISHLGDDVCACERFSLRLLTSTVCFVVCA